MGVLEDLHNGLHTVDEKVHQFGNVLNAAGNLLNFFNLQFGFNLCGSSNGLVDYCQHLFSDNRVLQFFYNQLYRDFQPDINGFTLIFMVPPVLSGYTEMIRQQQLQQGLNRGGGGLNVGVGVGLNVGNIFTGNLSASINLGFGGYGAGLTDPANLVTFAGIDFSPSQSQVNSEQVNSRSGQIPYATEVNESEQCAVTYIDNQNLDIYRFHHVWVEYIRDVLNGTVSPSDQYITGQLRGYIDYAASFYVVRYKPDMKQIVYAAKCTGAYPQSLPSKEIIGNRASNELTTLPFNYSIAHFREALPNSKNIWILNELNSLIMCRYGL